MAAPHQPKNILSITLMAWVIKRLLITPLGLKLKYISLPILALQTDTKWNFTLLRW
jgi:hypothetical protein